MHGNGNGQHPLAVLVANLDGDVSGIALGKLVAPDLSRRLRGLPLGVIEVAELQSLVIADEACPLANVEVEARHDLSPSLTPPHHDRQGEAGQSHETDQERVEFRV